MSKLDATGAYRVLHWGEDPDEELEVDDARYAGETLVALGTLTTASYTTTKGHGPVTEYVHDFEPPYPLLCIDQHGRLCIVGGGYVVTEHGIER